MSRARLERVPAGADDVDFFVGGVNSSFHGKFQYNTCSKHKAPRSPWKGHGGALWLYQDSFALRGPFHMSSGLDTVRNLNVSGSTSTVGHLTRGLSAVFTTARYH